MTGRWVCEQSTKRGANNEADIIGSAEQRHLPSAVIRRADIGNVALHDRTVAARQSAQQPDDERDIDIGRESERQIAQAIATHRADEQRSAADTVRQAPPEWFA